jgi:hypothetical protein
MVHCSNPEQNRLVGQGARRHPGCGTMVGLEQVVEAGSEQDSNTDDDRQCEQHSDERKRPSRSRGIVDDCLAQGVMLGTA